MDQVVSRREILEIVARRYGAVEPLARRRPGRRPSGSALPDGTMFGMIASTTAPFCRTCDRSRLTADGTWLLCLYGERRARPAGAAPGRRHAMRRSPAASPRPGRPRTDRGAEERRRPPDRGVLYQIESLRADPRREMHTRGG